MFECCDQLKAELDARRPLPPQILKFLHDHWVLEGIIIGGKAKAHSQSDYQDFLALSENAEIKAFETIMSLLV